MKNTPHLLAMMLFSVTMVLKIFSVIALCSCHIHAATHKEADLEHLEHHDHEVQQSITKKKSTTSRK